MKKGIAILLTITILLFSCSSSDNRTTVQDTYSNGQPKKTIYETIDDKNSYYEIVYDSLGRIHEIVPYSNGKKNGTQVYFRNDNLGVAALLPFKDDKRDGFTYEFYQGQQTAFKGESKDGEFNGLSTWFHKNGKIERIGIRTNGKQEGEWKEYYENGQLKGNGTYTNDVKQNDWTYWESNGTIDTTKQE